MDIQQEVQAVEKELVEMIILHLKENKLDVAKARQLAKDFLSILPVEDQKDLLNKLKQLGENYEEAKQIYADELAKVNDTAREQVLMEMRNFIHQGNLDGAIGVAKQYYAQQ